MVTSDLNCTIKSETRLKRRLGKEADNLYLECHTKDCSILSSAMKCQAKRTRYKLFSVCIDNYFSLFYASPQSMIQTNAEKCTQITMGE